MKTFNLFGSTGLIGTKSLKVINDFFPKIKINLLVANKNYKALAKQAFIYKPKYICLIDKSKYKNLKKELKNNKVKVILSEELLYFLKENHSDLTILSISGYASLNYIQSIIINTNILGSLNLLQVCKVRGVIKVINTSSSCLYGNLDIMSEDSKIYPIETPYAINKFTAEMYFTYFSHLYKLPTLNLRIFNTFGKYELAHRYRNVIPNFIDLALKNKPLTITGDGNETRDFTYVTDTIKLMVDMMDSELGDGDIFNAGTGKPTSIKYLAETIINKTNSKSEIIYKPRRNWDGVIDRLSDIEKSKVVFNYSPDITLEDGLDETIEWYSSVIF